jgi:hypothetical protein
MKKALSHYRIKGDREFPVIDELRDRARFIDGGSRTRGLCMHDTHLFHVLFQTAMEARVQLREERLAHALKGGQHCRAESVAQKARQALLELVRGTLENMGNVMANSHSQSFLVVGNRVVS